ncbi:sporulation protein Cse60 [Clostridium estertheticum]|uniref:sporulation protein Cse60 n=1 Tax=Clostridium estertheticum TaxID=238834 RepID=UPI001C7D5E37|nr:sporulation protein Cse60 [Clostridium estertheticum]MBX4265556.1 sporulation protein Cse60 [Clostridium estertheticum]MBX4271927.1 sporulation protein Cse60 [Clostridium estertheticum]WLC82100.1 sporulation protein Cse60 [Clostridium estertheticum]WLC91098.1 sporulation protein Cse60 [Clostridium estertheticum]
MKQVKIFSNESFLNLEEEVNDFIKSKDTQIYDIQYSTTSVGCFISMAAKYSTIIVYEEK